MESRIADKIEQELKKGIQHEERTRIRMKAL